MIKWIAFALAVGSAELGAQSDSTRLVELNRGYVDSFIYGQADWYDAHLSPEFLSISPDGSIISRAAFVNGARQPMTYKAFQLDSVKVRMLGDVALITAITPWERSDGTKGVSRYTDVWMKQGGDWKAVQAQITRIAGR